MHGLSNQDGHGVHGHHHHHGDHDAAAQGSGQCSHGGQNDPAQMFQQILQQFMQGQGC
jgi:hypothetical protein